MHTRKVIEVTVETRQMTVIRRRRPAVCAWCPACAATVEMVTPEQAAVISGQSVRAVYCQVEQGRFHFNETAEGWVRLCLNLVVRVVEITASGAPEAGPLG